MDKEDRIKMLNACKRLVKEMCSNISTRSGIYAFYRVNEDNEPCIYVGQAKNLLERTASHFLGTKQHIDKSLKKHGIYNETNPFGWKLKVLYECDKSMLDVAEQKYIGDFVRQGYKVYNVTGGGQIDKEKDINERQQTKLKSYKNGKVVADKKAKTYVKTMFDKYLDFRIKPPSNKIKQRKFEEFKNYLEEANED